MASTVTPTSFQKLASALLPPARELFVKASTSLHRRLYVDLANSFFRRFSVMPIRPYLTAGVVLAGAGVLLANPPGPAEPSSVQRVVNPLVAQAATDPVPEAGPGVTTGPAGSPAVAPWLFDVLIRHGSGPAPT